MLTAKYWKLLDDGDIECTLCPRHCRIKDQSHGMCLGRQRQDCELFAASYGLICGLAVDPIEKKPLRRFLPNSKTLSFGTTGCNLTCGFCQNDHLSRAETITGTSITPAEITDIALKYDCQSVAFTYNEPTVFFEFAIDTAKTCHEHGLKTVAVTNGWIEEEPRKEFYSYMDAANVDLKAFTDRFYKKLCGASLQPVLDSLIYIRTHTDVHLEITTLLIPGYNDSPAEIDAMTKWAAENIGTDVPWHFCAYHPTVKWKNAPPTPVETVLQAESIAKANGIKNIYLGNIR